MTRTIPDSAHPHDPARTVTVRRKALGVVLLAVCLLAARIAFAGEKPAADISGGELHVGGAEADGVKYRIEMQFFKTPEPGTCWDAVGRDAKGNIYLGNSSHRATSCVYRLDPRAGKMHRLGDLLSNVRYGGTEGRDNGKIHSGFVEWSDGCIYFPSHTGDDSVRYGGHLWKYDPRQDKILDLGIPVPGNTNFCISSIDPVRNVAYMVSTPSGILVRYNFKDQTFTALELTGKDWVRYLPMDAAGNLYIVGDNLIHKFDADKERFEIAVQHDDLDPEKSFDTVIGDFCWSKDRKRLYFVTYLKGTLFSWDVGSPTVRCLGRMHPTGGDLDLRTLYLNADGTRLYAIGNRGRGDKALYMFDIARAAGHRLLSLDAILDKEFEGKVRSSRAWVHFSDYGGVTGDDGTFYAGFHGGGRDQELDPDGLSFVALVGIRVTEQNAGGTHGP